MESAAVVIPFRPRTDPLANIGVVILTPGPGSRPDFLRALHRRAIAETPLQRDPDRQLAETFAAQDAVRRVALNRHVEQDPFGFALAVPVTTPQELADALSTNCHDQHVPQALSQSRTWALLVAVSATFTNRGIGRALANQALDGIRSAGGERVCVAVRSGAHGIHTRLLDMGFGRDGLTREIHARVLLSRDVAFVF